jgi:hypothetical protein
VLKFPGNQFKGEIAPALQDLVDSGTIRIVDILFMIKDVDGAVAVVEINELPTEIRGVYEPVVTDLTDMLTEEDAQVLATGLEPNSSGAIMLFENTWATAFRDAVLRANGELVLNERIPKAVIDAVLEERDTAYTVR